VTAPSFVASAPIRGSAGGCGSAFSGEFAGGAGFASACGADSTAVVRGDSTTRLLTADVSGVRVCGAVAGGTSSVAAFVVSGGTGGGVASDTVVAGAADAMLESDR